uniref:Zinc finger protein 618 n=1 Tax=Gasterosteus aculeatus TaxID=69293 RepID=G3PWE6_GASAC
PAEICVVIGGNDGGASGGGSRRSQTEDTDVNPHAGSYVCGVCGKKYKYYNCFQTHVRAHRESDNMVADGLPQTPNNSFRYSCDICGKKYKYYSCFQEHRDLHAVDDALSTLKLISPSLSDPYEQVVLPVDGLKEEEPVEPYQKIGPKTGSYVCEFCGKQYKYFNPYQEHVALHTPMGEPGWISPLHHGCRSVQVWIGVNLATAKLGFHKRGSNQPAANCTKYTLLKHATRSCLRSGSKRWNEDGELKAAFKYSPFRRKLESAIQSSLVDTNSSQNSSEPYTCGACGIQFQFYNNLLEHMQSHAADNENHTKEESPQTTSASGAQEQLWRSSHLRVSPRGTTQSASLLAENNGLPEKERQQVAERLLRVMCSDLSMLNVLNSKDFLKLAQTLVDTGARHGAYSTRDAFGNMSALALRQLPRMYNQIKVKVTCALGSNASLGIAVTCHSQTCGPDACYVLTAYQAEGARLKRYVLGVREAELREGPEQIQHWVQNVLSEFVMSDIRTVYVSEPKVWAAGVAGSPICLRCAGCSLGAVVQAVLGKRSLQARGLHELVELLSTCRDIAASASLSLREDHCGKTSASATEDGGSTAQSPTPPCWERTAEALLQVHAHFEQICEAYGRSKTTAPLLQGLNKHLLGTLSCLLAPLRLAALELSSQRRPTLQQVLPVYLRLEKFFTSKAGEAGTGTASKLCHYFLEALKENFKVERAHQVAMILDPQLKLCSVPAYQHEDIVSCACEMAAETRDGEGGGNNNNNNGGTSRGFSSSCTGSGNDEAQVQVKQEIFQYLAEPLLQGSPDLFQYWGSAVNEKFPRLSRLAMWLLAVPAVGIRTECVTVCEQSLAMKRRQQVTAEEMNKLIFLRSNMG